MADAPVVVGTSGYTFDDWAGAFYPAGLPAKARLDYYVARFAALELNATFYRLPTAEWLADFDRRTPPGYPIVVKAYRGLTHDPETPDPLPAFRDALVPLVAAGKLGAVLLQYPQRLHASREARDAIQQVARRLAPAPVVAEFRHASWAAPDARAWLDAIGVGWCVTDLPALPGLPPTVPAATGPCAYVRLHGRNAVTWHAGEGSLRYDWTYGPDVLRREWVPVIRDLAAARRRVFVFFNNCHRGQAAGDARALADLLAAEGLAAPPIPPPEPVQGTLFG